MVSNKLSERLHEFYIKITKNTTDEFVPLKGSKEVLVKNQYYKESSEKKQR